MVATNGSVYVITPEARALSDWVVQKISEQPIGAGP